jgi:hypothetical protein
MDVHSQAFQVCTAACLVKLIGSKTQICTLSDFPPDYCNAGSVGPVAVTAGPISSPPGGISAAPVSVAPVLPTSVSPHSSNFPTAPLSPPQLRRHLRHQFLHPQLRLLLLLQFLPPQLQLLLLRPVPRPTVPTSSTAPVPPPTVPTSSTPPISSPTAPSAPVLPLTSPPSPTAPIPAPTSSTECTDSDGTFAVDDFLQNQDCTWLADNQSLFGYLCRFLDVAVACKKTCNACQYFYP